MRNFKIYLAGKMGGISTEEANSWRKQLIEKLLPSESQYLYGLPYKKNLEIFNPCDYYNFDTVDYDSDAEVMNFDLRNLKQSDLMVVFFHKNGSRGTDKEMGYALANNIPIIGLHYHDYILHEWDKPMCEKIFSDIDKLAEYIKNFYLV